MYKIANIPWVRCLLCGDRYDIDRTADNWEEHVERHKQTKWHVKHSWWLDEQYVSRSTRSWQQAAQQERQKLMRDRDTFFNDPIDKNFYSWKTYEEHLLENGGREFCFTSWE